MLNRVLEGIGASIRFNDDEVIDKLVNKNHSALKPRTGLMIIASGNATTSQLNADEEGDAYFYSSGSDIPVGAEEELKSGERIACMDPSHFSSKVYPETESQQTPTYNLAVID